MKNHPAIQFLRLLDPSQGATFNIEHYTDVPKGMEKPKPDPLAGRHANLTIEGVRALLPKLELLNKEGAGVFVAVNQFDGHRQKANLTKVRGIHADLDGVDQSGRERIARLIEPTLTVQSSSADKQHWYWLLADGEHLERSEAECFNKMLVTLGADKAATDASRLLRLPGFKHMKYRQQDDAPTVTLIRMGARYHVEDLKSKLITSNLKQATNAKRQPRTAPVLAVDQAELDQIEEAVKRIAPALWGGDWRSPNAKAQGGAFESQSQADLALAGHIARQCAEAGIQQDQLPAIAEHIFSKSALADRDKWRDREDYRRSTIEMATRDIHLARGDAVTLESHGDIRNAKAFAARSRGKLVYVATRNT